MTTQQRDITDIREAIRRHEALRDQTTLDCQEGRAKSSELDQVELELSFLRLELERVEAAERARDIRDTLEAEKATKAARTAKIDELEKLLAERVRVAAEIDGVMAQIKPLVEKYFEVGEQAYSLFSSLNVGATWFRKAEPAAGSLAWRLRQHDRLRPQFEPVTPTWEQDLQSIERDWQPKPPPREEKT